MFVIGVIMVSKLFVYVQFSIDYFPLCYGCRLRRGFRLWRWRQQRAGGRSFKSTENKKYDRSLSEDFCIIIIEMHVIIIHLLCLYCSTYYESFVCFNGSGGCREMSILFQSEPAESATNLLNHNSIRTVYNIRLYENITYGDFFPSDNRPSYRSPWCDMR